MKNEKWKMENGEWERQLTSQNGKRVLKMKMRIRSGDGDAQWKINNSDNRLQYILQLLQMKTSLMVIVLASFASLLVKLPLIMWMLNCRRATFKRISKA